jgi:hypothetical protein
MGAFPLVAALVSAAFSIALIRQFIERRKPHQLAWGVAMASFAAASLSASVGMMAGWTPLYFRSYYLFGAVLNVPILALGTLYLYLPRKLGHAAAAAVLAASVVGAFAVFTADLHGSVAGLKGAIPAGSEVMAPAVRAMSRYYSYGGFLIVVAGAVWSALRLYKRPGIGFRRLAQGNALIALGTVVVALGSAFARQGRGSVFAIGLATGVSVMFMGFLRTRAGSPAPESKPVRETSEDAFRGQAAS